MASLEDDLHEVISKHERWTFSSVSSSPHDDDFFRDLLNVARNHPNTEAVAISASDLAEVRDLLNVIASGDTAGYDRIFRVLDRLPPAPPAQT